MRTECPLPCTKSKKALAGFFVDVLDDRSGPVMVGRLDSHAPLPARVQQVGVGLKHFVLAQLAGVAGLHKHAAQRRGPAEVRGLTTQCRIASDAFVGQPQGAGPVDAVPAAGDERNAALKSAYGGSPWKNGGPFSRIVAKMGNQALSGCSDNEPLPARRSTARRIALRCQDATFGHQAPAPAA